VANETPGGLPVRLSRRHVLSLTAAAAAAVATTHAAPAAAESAPPTGVAAGEVGAERHARPGRTPGARPSAASRAAALHLIRRATYGPTPRLVAEVRSRGTSAWLERQLRPGSIPDPVGSTLRSLYPEAGWSIPQVYRAIAAGQTEEYSWDVMIPLGQYTVAMATWSSRQLFEVMVEFWSNHLNVANTSDGVWDNRQDYDRRVIRAHALGTFSDLLTASASHPAMLEYLNQAESTKDAPNENYGRELLELHTVGAGAGYSEAMVVDSARIMTGHTIRWDERSRHHREFVYDPSVHWTGRVRVLGFSDRNARADGRPVARAYLRYLAHHPSTARNIARKLAVRFISDGPSDDLVNRLASVYLAHGTSIVPVLRALFGSAEFAASSGAKVRRPYEDLVATLRTLDYRLLPGSAGATRRRSGPEALYWTASDLGQAPLAWAPPNGYPDVAAAWGSAGGLVDRWNMHQGLAGGWWPAKDRIVVPNLPAMVPRRLTTYGALIDALATRLTGEPLPAKDTATVLTFLGRSPDARVGAKDPAVTWDLVRTVGVLLDTANHQLR
jgi:hypothetical protein